MKNEREIEILLATGKEWKRTHPRGYKVVVSKCNELLELGTKDIHLAVLLFELVRDSKISITSGMDKCLACLIEYEFPQFKNHFVVENYSTYSSERAAAIKLLQKILEI